ncbi:SDR family NAD(P)-dependent oxidoreductase [Nocardia paucivorans]|uniref:SDR family NAD(P)-dependent oxidoreductase n=1 Tax=Nocardia paucivorans TaxID=114259 RepID=UPI0005935A93|nr:SDR family NAD(P)-dependent oxidoreductase [Nocardia paucivorans]
MRAMVTGAGAGIGRAFAVALASQGCSVTAVARGTESLESLIAELGAGHDYLAADLGSDEGLRVVAQRLRSGNYTLLINNAGTATHGDFITVELESSLGTIDLNCRAVVTLAYAFLGVAPPGSAVVNVSSTLGHNPKPGLAVYSATKAFVTAFSETLWHEQRSRGIQVFALCPGVTATASQTATDVPPWLVQTPEQVVEHARKALSGRTGPVVFTGPVNRLFTAVLRLLPRRAALAAMSDRRKTK